LKGFLTVLQKNLVGEMTIMAAGSASSSAKKNRKIAKLQVVYCWTVTMVMQLIK